jgi:methionine sulfoxide reductase heme-binding subunit
VIAAAATASPSAYWYLARGTGAVALVLLTASVVLGVLGSLRFSAGPRWPRFAIDTLHRDVSLLVMVLLLAHIATSVLDSFASIILTDAVIPFAASYRPLWMGLGALSFDILLAVVLTSVIRRRVGYRAWRAVHWLAYASWPVAVLHGLGTGSDTKLWWMLALTGLCVVAVVVAVGTRIARAHPEHQRLRAPAAALTIATPIGLAVLTLAGPLAPDWARRAGTPETLLVKASTPASARVPAPTPPRRFSAKLDGTVRQRSELGGTVIDLSLRLRDGARGTLRVRMAGAPLLGGGLSMTGSQVDLLADGLPSVMQGQIVSLQGEQFVARVVGVSGPALNLRVDLQIDQDTDTATGTLAATPAKAGHR